MLTKSRAILRPLMITWTPTPSSMYGLTSFRISAALGDQQCPCSSCAYSQKGHTGRSIAHFGILGTSNIDERPSGRMNDIEKLEDRRSVI